MNHPVGFVPWVGLAMIALTAALTACGGESGPPADGTMGEDTGTDGLADDADVGADADSDAAPDLDADADPGTDETVVCIPPPDMGGICNVVTQCGCGPAERCLLGRDHHREVCYPVGTDEIDTRCSSPSEDNCVPQNQCLGRTASTTRCAQFCYDDGDCPEGRSCGYPIADVSRPDGGIWLCSPAAVDCNPFDGSGCPAGDACTVSVSAGARSCLPAGPGQPGDECGSADCEVGSGCYATSTELIGYCRKFCNTDPGGTPDCSDQPGTICDPLDVENFGVCWPD